MEYTAIEVLKRSIYWSYRKLFFKLGLTFVWLAGCNAVLEETSSRILPSVLSRTD